MQDGTVGLPDAGIPSPLMDGWGRGLIGAPWITNQSQLAGNENLPQNTNHAKQTIDIHQCRGNVGAAS